MRFPRGAREAQWPPIDAVLRAKLLPPKPIKPKRPLTAFMLFLQSLRAAVVAAPGGITEGVTTLAKRAGAEWQAMALAAKEGDGRGGQDAWREKALPAQRAFAIELAAHKTRLAAYVFV